MSQILTINGVIKPLKEADLASFIAHLLRLDSASRYDRFQGGMSDMAVMLYGEHSLEGKSVVYGYFVEEQLRGAVELKIKENTAEMAFSIEKSFQGKGIGSTLLSRMLIIAKHKNLSELRLSFLPSNCAMRRLSEKFDAELTHRSDQGLAVFKL